MTKKGKKEIDAKGASRRKFLGKAGGATAAIAAAGGGLPSLFGKENQHVEDLIQEARRRAVTRTRRFSDISGIAPDDGNAVFGQQRRTRRSGRGLTRP